MYVPSLVANCLYVYQMTHTGSPKRVVFVPIIVEISNIYNGKLIAKGVSNHASKAYEFSHFLPYSDSLQEMYPVEEEGKYTLPKPFAHDNVSYDDSNSGFKDEDQVESDLDIEDEV